MLKFGPDTFGALNADDYDALHDPGTTEESVALIAALAGDGARLLELAIGTGRLAIPLKQRGFDISGIEGSSEMVEKLRKKPGGADISVLIGDMADGAIEGEFDFAFLVFNTLFNLTSQEAQVRCFRNTAKRLRPGGAFLIETFVPDFSAYTDHQSLRTMKIGMQDLWFEAKLHDPTAQRIDFQRVRITQTGMKLVPFQIRYAWPAEIDLMAQLAGLELEDRWGGWKREPFAADSRMHVSL
ncbi:MAG: class I SAM-dependent methyltransferase, partial [Henriciella sp.]|uniref:class I SAM-dependent methyltransferase n=1 Tax=Henriciella sp. TaxID=1968823 RepID=UPI003C7339E1